jgi:hypothetical protein
VRYRAMDRLGASERTPSLSICPLTSSDALVEISGRLHSNHLLTDASDAQLHCIPAKWPQAPLAAISVELSFFAR